MYGEKDIGWFHDQAENGYQVFGKMVATAPDGYRGIGEEHADKSIRLE